MPCAVFTTLSSSADRVVTRERTALSDSAPPVLAASASWRLVSASASDDSAAATATAAPEATARATAAWAGALAVPDGGALARGALGGGSRGQRVGTPADGAQPLLHGAHLQPGLHLGVARGGAALRHLRALFVGELVLELRVAGALFLGLGLRELALQLGELDVVLLGGPPRRAHRGVQPLGLVGRRPRGAGQAAQPPGDLRRRGVGRLHPAARLLKHLPGGLLRVLRLRQGLRRRFAGQFRRGQPGRRLVGRRPHVEQ